MIKAAIFDLDGLLINSEPVWHNVTIQIYQTVGVIIDDDLRTQMIGRPPQENSAWLYQKFKWQGPPPDAVADMIIQAMVEAAPDISLKPGADRAINICKSLNLPVAIASSSPQAFIDAMVDTLKIREHFAHIYSAQHEPYGKPHPGVFLKVAEQFKLSPHDCVVFEDSPAGVLAAKAALMHCIAVPDSKNRNNKFVQTADLILDSLEEFNKDTLARL